MNKYLEIIIIVAVLSVFLASLKLAHGELRTLTSSDPDDPNMPVNKIIQYCLLHADRAAAGENVTQDLVVAGLIP